MARLPFPAPSSFISTRATLTLLSITVVALSSTPPLSGFPGPRIVGGAPASGQQFPFAAFGIVRGMDGTTQYLEACSGSLIVDYSAPGCTSNAQCTTDEYCVPYIDGNSYCQATWVLTAAHCLVNGFPPSEPVSGYNIPQWIFGNADRLSSTATTGLCTEIFVNPSYNSGNEYNDVALCKLGGTRTPINRAVLASGDDSAYTSGGLAAVAGWGRTADDPNLGVEQILRYVNIHTSTNAQCQADLNNRLPTLSPPQSYTLISSQLCAGGDTFGDNGKDSCQGDSGGPLFLQYSDGTPYLLGVTSQGWGCAEGPPGIYSRVTSFTQWIVNSQVCSRSFKESHSCSTTCSFLNKTGGTITCRAALPTHAPTRRPTTARPTFRPTTARPTTRAPSRSPTWPPARGAELTNTPTTQSPTARPTTKTPTQGPTRPPTDHPTTRSPTGRPTTRSPIPKPTTRSPTQRPTRPPTDHPTTRSPTAKPTTRSPIPKPTTRTPTQRPTRPPTDHPTTRSPTAKPTTRSPTAKPSTRSPTPKPTTRAPI